MLALKKCRIGEVQDSRWLRETKEECAGKDVFLLEIAKGRALDGSAPFDSEGGYVVVKLEFVKCFVLYASPLLSSKSP